jgi:hypothetical protein
VSTAYITDRDVKAVRELPICAAPCPPPWRTVADETRNWMLCTRRMAPQDSLMRVENVLPASTSTTERGLCAPAPYAGNRPPVGARGAGTLLGPAIVSVLECHTGAK